ncbi:MAG: DUF2244 domain-containing protein [Steroidobacteraceae bacterium]
MSLLISPAPPDQSVSHAMASSRYGHGRTVEQSGPGAVHIELRAHNSLTPSGMRLFLASVAIGPLLMAGFCVARGFWPVLPVVGLELALLWLALRWSLLRGQRRESITITQDFVTIAAQPAVMQANSRFPRHWTRVKLLVPNAGQEPSRLFFESGGRLCELGSFLTDDERRGLWLRLRELVGNMNDSPALS